MIHCIDVSEKNKKLFNSLVSHPLQSFEWGEFRKKTGLEVVRKIVMKNETPTDAFSITIHKIPIFGGNIGYIPKGSLPTEDVIQELAKIGKDHHCAYIQLEPNIINKPEFKMNNPELIRSFHPLFTKYTFILDLTKSEEELLRNMHQKTRYNIKVAQKNGVAIVEDNSKEGFETYINLSDETTNRQGFYAHTKKYHQTQWELFKKQTDTDSLSYHLFHAKYNDESGQRVTLASWVLFAFQKTLYYPYGASSVMFRNVMASNLLMWEAIRFGKKLNLESFDMWGALGPEPDTYDPWYGFHKFKQGYGATLTEFVGSFDLVLDPNKYQIIKIADKLRWIYLHAKKRLSH